MKTAFIGSLIIILPSALFLMYWQNQAVENIIIPDTPQQAEPLVTSSSTSTKLDPHMKWNDSNEYCLSWRVYRDGTQMMKDVGYCSF
ncbi:MAG: hypothetical protein HZC29_04820 [Thaumarchaeota archaeon]|nr:hypothetical protein [Nitrososphaerota archaeon]